MDQTFIMERIPHRPPFLWLDRVLELDTTAVRVETQFPPDLELCQGHYPNYPLLPGVILCEAIFQAGALLISELLQGFPRGQGVPVLTRILGAKFKREVRPGDTVAIQAVLKEQLGSVWFLKGSVQIEGKTAVQVEFACTLKQ
jgi:3-hydroxyacyl-[acyl-carrier-protein] dehydratase